jgi:hypothetical protein
MPGVGWRAIFFHDNKLDSFIEYKAAESGVGVVYVPTIPARDVLPTVMSPGTIAIGIFSNAPPVVILPMRISMPRQYPPGISGYAGEWAVVNQPRSRFDLQAHGFCRG